jgi:hypothetical protein
MYATASRGVGKLGLSWAKSSDVSPPAECQSPLFSDEMEESGVQLAAKHKAALFVPPEGRAGPAAVLRETPQIPSGVGELKYAR